MRNARGGNNPDVVKVALDCEAFGAEGITVHPRPDERHIRRSDVYELRPLLTTEFNIEGYPAPEFVDLVLKVKPHQVTLVPDAPDQITSNAGWDTKTNLSFLTELMDTFGQAGIRTSIFVGTDKEMIEYAAKAGADRVELYTEPYASAYVGSPEVAVRPEKIDAILGEQKVTGVQLSGGDVVELAGVFVALGVAGSTALARKIGAAVENDRIVTDEKMQTTVPGLYAAGDCTGGLLQVAKAVYEGALAGTEAAKALRKG